MIDSGSSLGVFVHVPNSFRFVYCVDRPSAHDTASAPTCANVCIRQRIVNVVWRPKSSFDWLDWGHFQWWPSFVWSRGHRWLSNCMQSFTSLDSPLCILSGRSVAKLLSLEFLINVLVIQLEGNGHTRQCWARARDHFLLHSPGCYNSAPNQHRTSTHFSLDPGHQLHGISRATWFPAVGRFFITAGDEYRRIIGGFGTRFI